MPIWSTPTSLKGQSVLSGEGPPTDDQGQVGSPAFVDVANGRIYGAKTSQGWPQDYLQLAVGGASGTLPSDLTGNSLVLSPVSGDSNAVRVQVLNSAGNPVFMADAMGNTTIAGTLEVTGQATLPSLNASNVVSSTQTVLTLQDVRGDLKVEGHSAVQDLQALTATVSGALQAGTLTTGDVEAGVINASGAISAKSLQVLTEVDAAAVSAQNLILGSAADEGKNTSRGLLHGNLEVHGDAQLTTLTATDTHLAKLAVTGLSNLAGGVLTGDIAASSLTLTLPTSGGPSLPFNIIGGSGSSVLSSDAAGNFSLAGTLTIAGSETSGALQTTALTAASIVNTGNTHLQGSLLVDGASTLGQVTAGALEASSAKVDQGLMVQGTSALAAVTATDLSTATLETLQAASIGGGLTVGGPTVLAGVTSGALHATSGTFDGGLSVAGGMSLGGNAALQAVSGTQAVFTGLHVTGDSALDGKVVAGPTTVPQLKVQLPQTNASSTPVSVTDASGNSLLTLTNQGQLTVLGQLVVNGGNADGAESLGALTVSSFLDQGNAEFQKDVKVDGNTVVGPLTAGAIAASTLNLSGNLQASGTGQFSGALTAAGLTTGPVVSSSVQTQGLNVRTDQFGNGGTLSVSVQANLPTTYTSDLHASSLAVSGGTSLSGNLGVSGATSLASLSVSGGGSLGSVSTGPLTASAGTFSGALTSAGAIAAGSSLSGQALVIKGNQSLPIQALDASGSTLLSLDGSGNLDIKGTLSVSGQATGQANNLGAVSVTSLVDSGNAQISQNLQVGGSSTLASLSVTGSSTLGATSLGATSTAALTAASLIVNGSSQLNGSLAVTGATTLAAVAAAAVNATSLTTSAGASVGTSLTVGGSATLQGLSAAASTLASLQVTNNAQVGGTLGVTGALSAAAGLTVTGNASFSGTAVISGATTVPSLSVSLPSSGASATPVTVKTSTNASLLSLDGQGNLTIAGAINAAGGTTSGGAISATSISDSGSLTVSGASTLAAVTVTSLVNTGSGTVGALVVQLPASNPAAKPINLLSSANASLFSVDSSGNALVSGTLGVTGATSLSTLATSGLATLSSASVSNNLAASTLSTSGTATLNALAVTNGATVGGGASIGGTATAGRFLASSAGSASAPLLSFVSSTGNPTGIYSDSQFGSYYEVTNGYLTRQSRYLSGPPADYGAGYLTHLYYTGISGAGNAAYRWYVGTSTVAMQISGSGALTLGSTLGVAGLTTSAGLTLSSGALTFADGTSLATATVPNQAAYTATAPGAAATPAFRFSGGTNPSGVFFDTTPGNVLVSVNGTKSLYSTAAAGAAQGANGWAIASTLGSGSALLALFGSGSTSSPVFSVDGAGATTSAGLLKSGGVTLTSGALTFADGTSMTTAATGTGGSSGSQVATGQLRYCVGPPTASNPSVQYDGDSVIADNVLLYGPRANGVWPTTPQGLQGPTGPAGFTSLPNATLVPGPTVLINNVTASSTTQVIPVPGSTNLPQTYFPQGPGALLGVGYFTSGVAITIELYDATANKSIYTLAIPANAYGNTGVFTTTQYPLTSGNQHVWRVTGSGSVSANIQPFYLSASTTNTPALSTIGGFMTAAGTAFTSTAIDIVSFGQTSAKQRNVVFARTASLVGLVGTYVPSAAGAAAASVTITVGMYNYSTGTATPMFTTPVLPNTGTPVNLGSYAPGVNTFPANTLLYMRVQGSGTGQVNVDAQVVV